MNPTRRIASALLVTALAASTAAAPAEAAASKPRPHGTADRPAAGYQIHAGRGAGSTFLGARKLNGSYVYRIDPGRRAAKSRSFGQGAWAAQLNGSGPRHVSVRDTARASWIVAKYGAYRYRVQNAAVELALDDLLVGGKWRLGGKKTRQRLAHIPARKKIARFAREMLNGSASFAGPYQTSVNTSDRPGGTTVVTVRVTTGSGSGIPNLPVTINYPGKPDVALRTDSAGNAVTTITGTSGNSDATAQVGLLPPTQLLVRSPSGKRSSRVVVAGVREAAQTLARPRIAVTGVAPNPMVVDQNQAGVQFAVSDGYGSARPATVTMYGPFTTVPGPTECGRSHVAGRTTVTISGDGGYAARISTPTWGYYLFGVELSADGHNAAASFCGGVTRAQVAPVISNVRPNAASIPIRGQIVGAANDGWFGATMGNLRGLNVTANLTLMGPVTGTAAMVPGTCPPGNGYLSLNYAVADGDWLTPHFTLGTRGSYWALIRIPAGEFNTAASNNCGGGSPVIVGR